MKVGQPIMVTVEDGSSVKDFKSFSLDAARSTSSNPVAATHDVSTSQTESHREIAAPQQSVNGSSSGRLFVSPYARKLAAEKGIDLTRLVGTGPNNRIIASDVLLAKLQPETKVAANTSPASVVEKKTSTKVETGDVKVVEAKAVATNDAAAIRAAMTKSKKEVPHYFLNVEVDVSSLQAIVAQLKKSGATENLTVTHLLVKAATKAMNKVTYIYITLPPLS